MRPLTAQQRLARLQRWGKPLERALSLYAAATPEQQADKLGIVKAILSPLKEAEAELRDALAALAAEDTVAINGELFRATVSAFDTNATDWKGLALSLSPTARQIANHTKSARRVDVRVKGLLTES